MAHSDLDSVVFSHDSPAHGEVQLIVDQQHFEQVVLQGMLKAVVSLDIATADFKAMLVPVGKSRHALSVVRHLVVMAKRGVEIRLLHAGIPSSAALRELKKTIPANLQIRRCPRLHAKAIIVDAKQLYLGSANLTGAGLGAKSAGRRNIEWGVWSQSGELIDGVLPQFNMLWDGTRCDTCQRHDICPQPLEEPCL